jgi:hypothetical protein
VSCYDRVKSSKFQPLSPADDRGPISTAIRGRNQHNPYHWIFCATSAGVPKGGASALRRSGDSRRGKRNAIEVTAIAETLRVAQQLDAGARRTRGRRRRRSSATLGRRRARGLAPAGPGQPEATEASARPNVPLSAPPLATFRRATDRVVLTGGIRNGSARTISCARGTLHRGAARSKHAAPVVCRARLNTSPSLFPSAASRCRTASRKSRTSASPFDPHNAQRRPPGIGFAPRSAYMGSRDPARRSWRGKSNGPYGRCAIQEIPIAIVGQTGRSPRNSWARRLSRAKPPKGRWFKSSSRQTSGRHSAAANRWGRQLWRECPSMKERQVVTRPGRRV